MIFTGKTMTNASDRNWYVFSYYDMSNTAVFVGMEQELPGDDISTKYSSCTKLDTSSGYRFSDTELSRVVGAKVLGYGMTRDEADMAVKVTRNLITDCMPKAISENMLKVRFVKSVGVEISTGALEDNSTLSDEELPTVDEEEINNSSEDTADDGEEPNPEQEDIRLRLDHTKSLILYTLAKNDNNTEYSKYYLRASEELRKHILDLGKTPEDALSGPSVLAKRSKDELEKSLIQVNKYQEQYKFESVLEDYKPSPVIDTSQIGIEEDDDAEELQHVLSKLTPASKSTPVVKGTKLTDEEFKAVIDDFTQSIAKRKQEEIDKLMGVKKPHPLDNIQFDEEPVVSKKTPPKSFEVVAEKPEPVVTKKSPKQQDADLGELDEQLRLTHFKMILLQVRARRMGRDDLVDNYANKAENLRKQIIALGVSELQDIADIAVVGRMKNSELKAAIEEVKQAELESKSTPDSEAKAKEKLEDLRIANNIDQEIINHQKRTGTGTAKERNLLRKKIAERKQRIEELEG